MREEQRADSRGEPPSFWRLQLAQQIAPAYTCDSNVVAVFAHGSAARLRADEFSDVELAVLWSEPPSDAQRQAAIDRATGTLPKLSGYEPLLQAWTEEYHVEGVKIDMGHWTVETIGMIIDAVTVRYDTTFAMQTTLRR